MFMRPFSICVAAIALVLQAIAAPLPLYADGSFFAFFWGSSDKEVESDNKADRDWETRLKLARVLSYQKRYDESLAEYRKVLEINPDLVEVKVEMATIYYYQKQYEPALELLDQVPSKDRTLDVELLIADIYLIQKHYAESEEIYRKVLASSGDQRDQILFRLAQLLSWQKQYDKSLAIYKELVAKHPNDKQLKRKYALVLRWSGRDLEAAQILESTLS
jgi:tetratricopeptide (TPR) repeat protein